MSDGPGFEERLEALDPTLFEGVPSQTSDHDRRSLLACQLFARSQAPSYTYLEIGSYLGGSIQTHLLDDRCRAAYSIDLRPQPRRFPPRRKAAAANTTERMRELLAERYPSRLDKLTCIEGDTRSLDPGAIPEPIDLCFIDGEHTDEAIVSDFEFCRAVLADRGAIVFHDAEIVYIGLREIIAGLQESGTPFHAYNLPTVMLVVELGAFPIHAQPRVAGWLLDNHVGYLESLNLNDRFRRLANMAPILQVRKTRAFVRRTLRR